MTESLVCLRAVRKSFGRAEVLHGLDLDVPAGRITGLLGPSGHGKTTLVNIIVGASRMTSGQGTVLGDSLPPATVKRQIGFMPQSDAVYDDLTGEQNLRYFGALYGLDKKALDAAIPRTLADVSLTAEPRKLVGAYSGGMKRRLSLAIALLHSPRLLVLDEPTVGLDPVHRIRLWATFRELTAGGATLLITTHVMDEAAGCDDIVMLHDGRIIAQGAPNALIAQVDGVDDLEAAFLAFEEQAERAALAQPAGGASDA
jgi:ABC-2 type transport system ATP-binding protein